MSVVKCLKDPQWDAYRPSCSTLFVSIDGGVTASVISSEVSQLIQEDCGNLWALFVYCKCRNKIKWQCPLCPIPLFKTKSLLSLKLSMIRHLKTYHGDVHDSLQVHLNTEWMFLERKFGTSFDVFQNVPKYVKRAGTHRSSINFVSLLDDPGLIQVFGTEAFCEICCEGVKSVIHLQKHSHLKSKPGFSEFFPCEESLIDQYPFPHPLLAYGTSIEDQGSDGLKLEVVYKWHCRFPSCSSCQPCTSPSTVILKAYALNHLEECHEGIFSFQFYKNEWLILHAEAGLSDMILCRHRLEVQDDQYPDDFLSPFSKFLIPFACLGYRICGFCFFPSRDDEMMKRHLEEHGYEEEGEPFLHPKSLAAGVTAVRDVPIHFIKFLQPLLHLYGDKKIFKEKNSLWDRGKACSIPEAVSLDNMRMKDETKTDFGKITVENEEMGKKQREREKKERERREAEMENESSEKVVVDNEKNNEEKAAADIMEKKRNKEEKRKRKEERMTEKSKDMMDIPSVHDEDCVLVDESIVIDAKEKKSKKKMEEARSEEQPDNESIEGEKRKKQKKKKRNSIEKERTDEITMEAEEGSGEKSETQREGQTNEVNEIPEVKTEEKKKKKSKVNEESVDGDIHLEDHDQTNEKKKKKDIIKKVRFMEEVTLDAVEGNEDDDSVNMQMVGMHDVGRENGEEDNEDPSEGEKSTQLSIEEEEPEHPQGPIRNGLLIAAAIKEEVDSDSDPIVVSENAIVEQDTVFDSKKSMVDPGTVGVPKRTIVEAESTVAVARRLALERGIVMTTATIVTAVLKNERVYGSEITVDDDTSMDLHMDSDTLEVADMTEFMEEASSTVCTTNTIVEQTSTVTPSVPVDDSMDITVTADLSFQSIDLLDNSISMDRLQLTPIMGVDPLPLAEEEVNAGSSVSPSSPLISNSQKNVAEKCVKCNQHVSNEESSIVEHVKEHLEKSYRCQLCAFQFSSKPLICVHLLKDHEVTVAVDQFIDEIDKCSVDELREQCFPSTVQVSPSSRTRLFSSSGDEVDVATNEDDDLTQLLLAPNSPQCHLPARDNEFGAIDIDEVRTEMSSSMMLPPRESPKEPVSSDSEPDSKYRLLRSKANLEEVDPEYARKAIRVLVKRAQTKGLSSLVTVLESRDSSTECVTIQPYSDGRIGVDGKLVIPQKVSARIWRWPVVTTGEMERLPCCDTTENNKERVCINPYHFQRGPYNAEIMKELQNYQKEGVHPDYAKKFITYLVKKLKKRKEELDALMTALESRDSSTECVTIQPYSDGRICVDGKMVFPHVVSARIWRWPDVTREEIEELSCCGTFSNKRERVCINPYHYERGAYVAEIVKELQNYQKEGVHPDYAKKFIMYLVKKLRKRKDGLDALMNALKARGSSPTQCVTVDTYCQGQINVSGDWEFPHIIYSSIWRFPNVKKHDLRKLSCCATSSEDRSSVCVNPWHYNRYSEEYGQIVEELQRYQKEGEDSVYVRKAIDYLVKSLDNNELELEALKKAISSNGSVSTLCVTMKVGSRGSWIIAGREIRPEVLYCRIWRWSEVCHEELRKLTCCTSSDRYSVCVNPFHYERVGISKPKKGTGTLGEKFKTSKRIMDELTWKGGEPPPCTNRQGFLMKAHEIMVSCPICKRSFHTPSHATEVEREWSLLAHFIVCHSSDKDVQVLVNRKRWHLAKMRHWSTGDMSKLVLPFRLQTTGALVCSSCVVNPPASFRYIKNLNRHWEVCARNGGRRLRKPEVQRKRATKSVGMMKQIAENMEESTWKGENAADDEENGKSGKKKYVQKLKQIKKTLTNYKSGGSTFRKLGKWERSMFEDDEESEESEEEEESGDSEEEEDSGKSEDGENEADGASTEKKEVHKTGSKDTVSKVIPRRRLPLRKRVKSVEYIEEESTDEEEREEKMRRVD